MNFYPKRSEDKLANREEAFLASLDDQRRVWLNGKQVKVKEEEAFHGTIQTIGRLFRMLDDAKLQER